MATCRFFYAQGQIIVPDIICISTIHGGHGWSFFVPDKNDISHIHVGRILKLQGTAWMQSIGRRRMPKPQQCPVTYANPINQKGHFNSGLFGTTQTVKTYFSQPASPLCVRLPRLSNVKSPSSACPFCALAVSLIQVVKAMPTSQTEALIE